MKTRTQRKWYRVATRKRFVCTLCIASPTMASVEHTMWDCRGLVVGSYTFTQCQLFVQRKAYIEPIVVQWNRLDGRTWHWARHSSLMATRSVKISPLYDARPTKSKLAPNDINYMDRLGIEQDALACWFHHIRSLSQWKHNKKWYDDEPLSSSACPLGKTTSEYHFLPSGLGDWRSF